MSSVSTIKDTQTTHDGRRTNPTGSVGRLELIFLGAQSGWVLSEAKNLPWISYPSDRHATNETTAWIGKVQAQGMHERVRGVGKRAV